MCLPILAPVPERELLERRTTELLQRLIQFDTVNPPGNEQEAQEWLRGLLEDAGFECEFLSAVEGRPNLVARLTGGSDGPVLGYMGHVDTVLADPDDWSVDPWSGEVRDGCVWGRGALDMKSQVAAEAAAALLLAEEGWRPESGELKLIFTADEEAGGSVGAAWLCENHPDKVRCDYIINEGGGDSVEFEGRKVYFGGVAEKGVFRFSIVTSGKAGHASIPRIGENALLKMAPILEALRGGRPALELSTEPEAFLEALGIEMNDGIESAFADLERRDPRFALLVEPTLGVTMTPTMIEASSKVNVIPARARLRVDCRVPPERGEEHARKRVEEAIGDVDYELVFDEMVEGSRSPIDTELMQHIRDFVEREDPGAVVAPTVLPGFTDSRSFRDTFPDCIAYGFFPRREMDLFEAAPLIHGADERIPVSDLGMAARFFAELAPKVLR
jgi:acetylornithine deacetylase/succinyl-diaminopimelate desuccinylase-like protein